MALICDTGPRYAAMDEADQDHAACAALLVTSREPLVVPAPVLVELDWLAGRRLGPTAFAAFMADVVDGRIQLLDLTRGDYARVREISVRYADLPLGFVDAAVVAVAERLGEYKLATLDHRHYHVVRPRHTPAFILLPEIR